jgi:hypothetical protein
MFDEGEEPGFDLPIKPANKDSLPLDFKWEAGSTGELALYFNQKLTPHKKFERR